MSEIGDRIRRLPTASTAAEAVRAWRRHRPRGEHRGRRAAGKSFPSRMTACASAKTSSRHWAGRPSFCRNHAKCTPRCIGKGCRRVDTSSCFFFPGAQTGNQGPAAPAVDAPRSAVLDRLGRNSSFNLPRLASRGRMKQLRIPSEAIVPLHMATRDVGEQDISGTGRRGDRRPVACQRERNGSTRLKNPAHAEVAFSVHFRRHRRPRRLCECCTLDARAVL
jgi:hypothetical protein